MSNVKFFKAGDRYERIMLTGKSYVPLPDMNRVVEYICDCGAIRWAKLANVRRGYQKSCGCFRNDGMNRRGLSKHKLYGIWKSIQNRCLESNEHLKKYYFDCGITVCEEWAKSFDSFYNWALENGWQKGLTIDRKDNSKGYSPLNCRWVTMAVQNRNKTNNNMIVAFGENKCLLDWLNDERCHLKNSTSIKKRIKKGWSIEDAISKPSTTYNKNHIYK